MLNAHRLHLLAELRRLGTLGEVAASLQYSPSAVSQQLAQLEREAGVPLLQKHGRRVRLTEAAEVLADRADAVVELLEQAESDLVALGESVSGTLRVASFDTPLLSVAPAALTAFRRQYPNVEVQIQQREVSAAMAGLLSQDLDVIVGEEFPGLGLPRTRGIDRQEVFADALLLVVPPTGPWSQPARVRDLADAPWALDPESTSAGSWALAALREAGIEPRLQFEMINPLLQASLVRSGHALALLPTLVGAENLAGTRLFTLPGAPRRRLFTAARAGRAGHPAIRAFREAFADAARAIELDADAPLLPA